MHAPGIGSQIRGQVEQQCMVTLSKNVESLISTSAYIDQDR